MISKGYVGLFKDPLTGDNVREFVASWLERFERVEQVSGGGAGAVTVRIESVEQIIKEDHQQFRVLMGDDFAWVYVSKGNYVIETTGMPADDISVCLDVLLELPGLVEVIDQKDDKRLDELEAKGLM